LEDEEEGRREEEEKEERKGEIDCVINDQKERKKAEGRAPLFFSHVGVALKKDRVAPLQSA
jgi:hypothetical protein